MELIHVVIPALEIDIPEELYAMVEKLAKEHDMGWEETMQSILLGSVIEMSCPKG